MLLLGFYAYECRVCYDLEVRSEFQYALTVLLVLTYMQAANTSHALDITELRLGLWPLAVSAHMLALVITTISP